MKPRVKENVVLKEIVEEVNKIVKDEVMKKNVIINGGNVCHIQYVWESIVINPKKKAKNVLVILP